MPMVDADWSITRSNGNIRYIGDDHGGASPSYATVDEFRLWLGDFSDDATSSGDDELDITDEFPYDRSTDQILELINSYNIDDNAAEHLYNGSITQDGGNVIYDPVTNFGTATNIQIIQNGAVLSDDWWNSNGGLNSDASNNISHRFLVKVRTAGADIDGRRIVATSREFGNTYSEFSINGTSRGANVLALSEADDLNNETAAGTVATWTTVTNTEGYQGIDVDNNGSNEFYYSQWDKGSQTINEMYERLKWLTRQGSSSTLYGLNGELFRGITHEVVVDTPTGTFQEPEALSWSGGTGQLLAINSTTAATKLWMQLLTGVAPTDGQTITGGTSSATVDVNVTVTTRTVSTPFVGVSTGSAIIGAYGLGIESADLSSSDRVFDLDNNQVIPPNNVSYVVSSLVSGEDYVLIGPESGGALDKAQFGLNTALTTDNITSVVIDTAIPADTPTSGTIRVVDNNGRSRKLDYSSYTGSTFTITTTNGEEDFATVNASAANDVYITYIDKLAASTQESFTVVYSSDRALYIKVIDGGSSGNTPTKPYIITDTLTSTGGSTSAIRTSDS